MIRIEQLVEAARAEGVELVGPGGLLTGLTGTVEKGCDGSVVLRTAGAQPPGVRKDAT
jgi:hypothetical protein